jgi:hypothetical protein
MASLNFDRIAKLIHVKGAAKKIDPDITHVVILYYMSKNKENVDVDNLLNICNIHKCFFVEAIHSDKAVRNCYAKDTESLARTRLTQMIRSLADLQTAIGMHYYNMYDGHTFYKRLNAVQLFQKAIHNPLAQFYLGTYYTTDCLDPTKYQEGIRLHSAFLQHTDDIPVKEAKYRKDVDDIIQRTMYHHKEVALLEFSIECAERNVEKAASELAQIQHEKDTLRRIAVENACSAVDFVKNLSDFKVDGFYNAAVLNTQCY